METQLDKIKSKVVCPVELTLRILGGKWRGSILYQMKDGPLRFNELKYRVQDGVIDYDGGDNFLSNKVLTNHLTALLEFDLIEKKEVDDHSFYQLSSKGESAIPLLIDLFYWGLKHF